MAILEHHVENLCSPPLRRHCQATEGGFKQDTYSKQTFLLFPRSLGRGTCKEGVACNSVVAGDLERNTGNLTVFPPPPPSFSTSTFLLLLLLF